MERHKDIPTSTWRGTKTYLHRHGEAQRHAYLDMERHKDMPTSTWRGTEMNLPWHGEIIVHNYYETQTQNYHIMVRHKHN